MLESRRYRRCQGTNVAANDGSWRLALVPGRNVYVMIGGQPDMASTAQETEDMIPSLVARGGVLADLFAVP